MCWVLLARRYEDKTTRTIYTDTRLSNQRRSPALQSRYNRYDKTDYKAGYIIVSRICRVITMDNLKNLILSRCDNYVAEEIKATKTQKEFLDYLFREIDYYIENNIITPDELISHISPVELFHYGFLTQDNNPIDFTQLVTIDGVKWYNYNEELGVICDDDDTLFEDDDKKLEDEDGEFYETSVRKLRIKFAGKRLPKTEELENLLNHEESLGYYNGTLCKVFDKKLVFPIYEDVGYMSEIRKADEFYQCMYLSIDDSAFVSDSDGKMLIRCVKSRSTSVNKNKSSQNQNKEDSLPVEIGETTNPQNLSDAQALLNDLHFKLEKLELRGKNVVIEAETFNTYLFGTIRNILKDMGVNFQTLVKKSTNCVLVGDKRRPSKYTRLKIETYRQEGQKISLMKISVLDTPTISTTITEIPTNITQKNIVQNKKLQKIIRVLWCILGFIFLIILLATTT